MNKTLSLGYLEMKSDWERLLGLGPKFMGTRSADKAASFLAEQLSIAGYEVMRQEFSYLGWVLKGEPYLKIIRPVARRVEAYPFLWSGSTGSGDTAGNISGQVVYLGKHNIWGMYDWDKFAITDESGAILGYISGRPAGPAIPQVLSHGSSRLPHFIVGESTLRELHEWIGRNLDPIVEGSIWCEYAPGTVGANIIGRPRVKSPGQRVVVSAHYDTMYNTSGGYDNAAGSACLLELARRLSKDPVAGTVEFVFFGAEEWALAGSKAYIQAALESGNMRDIKALLNLDGVGRGDELEVWVGPEPFETVVQGLIRETGKTSGREVVYKFPPPPGSDHAPFYTEGIPVCMLTFNDQPILHRPEDGYDEKKLQNMAFTVDLAERLARAFSEPAFLAVPGPVLGSGLNMQ
ncbi:MAG: M28 family metallopeptidase [Firmicutes bacterium]|nr:M28 family metallopeptidase [Bacillota bacterium]